MKLQRLYSYVRQALDDYQMIEDQDKIAIGVSGGKDSLTLLYALSGLQKFYPKKFQCVAIAVNLGYEGFDLSEVEQLCETLEIPFYMVNTTIKDMIQGQQCSLCARLRKGALDKKALELGCNKIAYAHNRDDVVETMMLSLIYEGRFTTFWPVTHFEDQNLNIIRPLIYVPLAEVIGFRNKYHLPVKKNPCPYDKETERTYIRTLLKEIDQHTPGVKKRLMTAIQNGNLEVWKEKREKGKENESSSTMV